jgi:hypothetical protein
MNNNNSNDSSSKLMNTVVGNVCNGEGHRFMVPD